MTEVSFKITGLKELAANRDKLSKTLEQSMIRTALNNAAKPVVKRAKENVLAHGLVESGDLAKGIAAGPGTKSAPKITKAGFGFVRIGPLADQFYGLFHELGTSQHPAKPWLRPALEQASKSGEIRDAFFASLNKSIARALKESKSLGSNAMNIILKNVHHHIRRHFGHVCFCQGLHHQH